MLRIYLDQAEWVDMSKCRTGHREGGRFQEAYDLSTRLVERGDISFVISAAHYYETQRRRNPISRRDLGRTIADLSKFHSIAPSHMIFPAEIRVARFRKLLVSSGALGQPLQPDDAPTWSSMIKDMLPESDSWTRIALLDLLHYMFERVPRGSRGFGNLGFSRYANGRISDPDYFDRLCFPDPSARRYRRCTGGARPSGSRARRSADSRQ